MPIHPDLRLLYPPNWLELASQIKFERAGGRCKWCNRPYGERVWVIKDGGWLDPITGAQYNDQVPLIGQSQLTDWPKGRFVKTILSCAHLDHLAALCQRCHLRHDRLQHQQSAYRHRRQHRAIADLFEGEHDRV